MTTDPGNDRTDDEREQELLDAEEPVIEGAPPRTAGDFYADSTDVESEWGTSGPAVSGEGWTATGPGN